MAMRTSSFNVREEDADPEFYAHGIVDCARRAARKLKNHCAPAIDQALQWLDICADEESRPVYVHCHHGKGRTSTFTALVRLAQGWNVDRAITEEIEVFGFPDEPEQVAFLREFSERMRNGQIKTPDVPNESGVTPDFTTAESASGG